jgi:methylated-DNA-[protein]-cysteine S-methyltransferase
MGYALLRAFALRRTNPSYGVLADLTSSLYRGAVRETKLPQLSLHSPIGDLTISEEAGEIVALDWGWGRDQASSPLLERAKAALFDYFDGKPIDDAIPLNPHGTPYRRRVWEALRRIPPGETRTYLDIARLAGGSPRSVGGANGANPIPILIPCHRVVAVGGIGGYSGGDGLPTKLALLNLERGIKI